MTKVKNLLLTILLLCGTTIWGNNGLRISGRIKVLKHSVVISGKSFDECKAEFDRVCNGVKKDFSVE
mgnify:CR=1 FL=1